MSHRKQPCPDRGLRTRRSSLPLMQFADVPIWVATSCLALEWGAVGSQARADARLEGGGWAPRPPARLSPDEPGPIMGKHSAPILRAGSIQPTIFPFSIYGSVPCTCGSVSLCVQAVQFSRQCSRLQRCWAYPPSPARRMRPMPRRRRSRKWWRSAPAPCPARWRNPRFRWTSSAARISRIKPASTCPT